MNTTSTCLHFVALTNSANVTLDDTTSKRTFASRWLQLTHHSMAAIGAAALVGMATIAATPNWRVQAAQWLHTSSQQHAPQEVAQTTTPSIVTSLESADNGRFMATELSNLNARQANVAEWISKKYKVAPEAIGVVVQAAWDAGKQADIDPLLVLAVMAVESSFNPFAQSPVGAQGLMQVMTTIHTDKYTPLGGNLAALDPVTNLQVGVQVLKETIQRAGSVRGGLKHYAGAANLDSDDGYGDKVLTEYTRLRAVAQGKTVSATANLPIQQPTVAIKKNDQGRIVKVSMGAETEHNQKP